MALKTRVKVSGVKDLSNARYCAGMGVEWLSFDMDTMDLAVYQEIKNWLVGVKIIGFTQSQECKEIIEKVNAFTPDLLEVTNEITYESIRSLINLPIICQENIIVQQADFIQIDYKLAQNINVFDNIIVDVSHIKPSEIEDLDQNFCLNITADKELRPGFSNFDAVMDWLEYLEID